MSQAGESIFIIRNAQCEGFRVGPGGGQAGPGRQGTEKYSEEQGPWGRELAGLGCVLQVELAGWE